MSQRNPMNERYQQEDRSGKTRKSAASAKPTTRAAASVHVPGQGEKPKGIFAKASAKAAAGDKKREATKRNARAGTADPANRALMYNPQIPEYKQWRRYWWIAIACAMVFTVSSFVALSTISEGPLPLVLLGIGYVFLALAIVIDIFKVRKIRKAYQEDVLNNRSKDATKSRKERKAAEKQRLLELEEEEKRLEAERAAKQEARSERWGKFFGRGKAAAEAGILPKEGEGSSVSDSAAEDVAITEVGGTAASGKKKRKGKVAQTVEAVKGAQVAAAVADATVDMPDADAATEVTDAAVVDAAVTDSDALKA